MMIVSGGDELPHESVTFRRMEMTTTTNQNVGPLYECLALALDALANCERMGNGEWAPRWRERLAKLERELPSGSGFDNGTRIDYDRSTGDKFVLTTAFHHMNDAGFYDGWTEHTVTIRPSFISRFTVEVSGRNRNGIKDFIADSFASALRDRFEQTADGFVRVPWRS